MQLSADLDPRLARKVHVDSTPGRMSYSFHLARMLLKHTVSSLCAIKILVRCRCWGVAISWPFPLEEAQLVEDEDD